MYDKRDLINQPAGYVGEDLQLPIPFDEQTGMGLSGESVHHGECTDEGLPRPTERAKERPQVQLKLDF